jgi:hypothetical protein
LAWFFAGAAPALQVQVGAGAGANRFVLEDTSGLKLFDAASKTRAILGVDKDGSGLVLLDENGKAIWSAP